VIAAEGARVAALVKAKAARKVAFQSPCSLQHGLKIQGVVESILRDTGYTLTAVPDGHLCCGSAGTYSLLKPGIAQQLLHNKVRALESGTPDVIATANIGCLSHVQSGTRLPVRHWIELVDARMGAPA
jgi:glycolate oxidase iron-sulfur subunit